MQRDEFGRVKGGGGEGELLFFTSGTTSSSKIVRLTSESLCTSAWSGQCMLACGKGDLILRVKVEIPRRLTNKQKDLLREFDATTGDREYENRKSFMDRVKELFQ